MKFPDVVIKGRLQNFTGTYAERRKSGKRIIAGTINGASYVVTFATALSGVCFGSLK